MKILVRYILKESFGYFMISLFAFTGVLLTGRLLKLTSLIVNKGVNPWDILMLFVSIIPTFLEFAVPMSVLLGVMLAFARLSGDSEVVVVRASGVSLYQLIRPVVVFGIWATLVSLYVSQDLRPWGNQQMSKIIFEIARTKSTAGLNEGMFNKLGNLILYAERIDPITGDLKNIIIDDKRNPARRQIIAASSGHMDSNEQKQTISVHLSSGSIHENREGNYAVTDFNTNRIVMNSDEIYNPDAKKDDKRRGELSLAELDDRIKNYHAEMLRAQLPVEASPMAKPEEIEADRKEQAARTAHLTREMNKMRIEKVRRFSMPFAALCLALIGMPLGIQPPRAQKSWGISISVCLGILVFLIYYAMLSIGMILSESGAWNPYFGLWLPNLLVAAIGIYTQYKMGSEKWQSILHGFEIAIQYIAGKIPFRQHA